MLSIDETKCDGCKLCGTGCPFGAIEVVDKLATVLENCTLCGACVNVCPKGAISIQRKKPSPEDLAKFSGVFVWGECEARDGGLTPRKVVYELLSRARILADKLNQEVVVVSLGDERLSDLNRLIAYGADRVLRCRHKLLAGYTTDGFANVISAVISKQRPAVFLYGATPNGRDLAPRIAARLHLGLTADCTGLDIDDAEQLVQTRPAFGGNIMASIISPYTRPQMATVRPNVFAMPRADESRSGKIEDIEVRLSKAALRTKVVEEIKLGEAATLKIDEAQIIVSAGRGCQSKENLKLVKKLAEQLGGAMAGSRAIVELDWIPHTLQVGQSGTTVGPELYIAVGISGAIQHIVGMSSSKKIVAINSDPEAPIFKIADLGIVGDALDILPRVLDAVKREKEDLMKGEKDGD